MQKLPSNKGHAYPATDAIGAKAKSKLQFLQRARQNGFNLALCKSQDHAVFVN